MAGKPIDPLAYDQGNDVVRALHKCWLFVTVVAYAVTTTTALIVQGIVTIIALALVGVLTVILGGAIIALVAVCKIVNGESWADVRSTRVSVRVDPEAEDSK